MARSDHHVTISQHWWHSSSLPCCLQSLHLPAPGGLSGWALGGLGLQDAHPRQGVGRLEDCPLEHVASLWDWAPHSVGLPSEREGPGRVHQRTKRHGRSGLAFHDLASESHSVTATRSGGPRVTEPKCQRRAPDPTSRWELCLRIGSLFKNTPATRLGASQVTVRVSFQLGDHPGHCQQCAHVKRPAACVSRGLTKC